MFLVFSLTVSISELKHFSYNEDVSWFPYFDLEYHSAKDFIGDSPSHAEHSCSSVIHASTD